MAMKIMRARGFLNIITVLVLGLTLPVLAKDQTEEQLILELASPNENKIVDALFQLEKKYPAGTNAIPIMKKFLADPRAKVRRKAARVLGALHTEVNAEDLKSIGALLKASDMHEIVDGLKALRGLKAQATVPEITPLLKHPHPNVVRDACRTLAVLGNKDLIPLIEPLTSHKNKTIQTDARETIHDLNTKQ